MEVQEGRDDITKRPPPLPGMFADVEFIQHYFWVSVSPTGREKVFSVRLASTL